MAKMVGGIMDSKKLISDSDKAQNLYDEIINYWEHTTTDETGEDYFLPMNFEQFDFAQKKLAEMKKLDAKDSDVKELTATIENILNDRVGLSFEWHNQIINKWDHAEVDPETGKELRHPTSMEQVQFARDQIDEIEKLGVDDPEFNQAFDKIKEITLDAPKRVFSGSKWIMIIIGVFVAITSFSMFGAFFNTIGNYYSKDLATSMYAQETKNLENRIITYENQPETSTTKVKYLKEYKKKLEKHKKMSPEKYLKKCNSKKRAAGFKGLFTALFLIGLYGGYFFASKAPQYLINRRKKERQMLMKSSNFLKKAIFGTISTIFSTPTTTTVTKWSDGSTTRESDAGAILFIGILVTFIILAIVFMVMIYALPFLVIINYLRNYQNEKVHIYYAKIKNKIWKK